jgi:hypothetical protein
MKWYMLFLFVIGNFSITQAVCSPPIKFYIDCGQTRTAGAAYQFCASHQMTVVNLTNGSATFASDIALLNTTLRAENCTGNFWFSSGSQSGLYTNADSLDDVSDGLLGAVLNVVLCLIPFLCPAATTTTTAPVTAAYTICTRPIQQHVTQKCQDQVQRSDMKQFRFNEQTILAGVLHGLPTRSLMACTSFCSSNDICIGMSYIDGTCTLKKKDL